MAITGTGDVFSPQVIADIVTKQLYAATPLLGTGYVSDARANAIRGGDNTTVLFPYIKGGDANAGVQANPRDGNAVTPDEFAISYGSETIYSKIVSYMSDEKALRMAAQTTDPNTWVAMDVIKRMRATLHAALIASGQAAAVAASSTYTEPTNQASIRGIKKAITKLWGEHAYDDGTPLCICNSKVADDLQNSTEVAQTGVYGYSASVPVGNVFQISGVAFFVSDHITVSDTKYPNLIVMPGALQLWADMALGSGQQRKPGTTAIVSDWWFEYATHTRTTLPVPAIEYICAATADSE